MKMKIFRKMIPAFGSRLRRLSVVLSILLLPPAGAAEEPAARGTPRENGNAFLLVNSPDGRGGAFFATIWKQPVILTSARTWFELSSPTLCDANGRSFRIREVLESRKRDLVILGYEPPEGEPPVPLALPTRTGVLPPGREVYACGGGEEAGAITVRYGRVTGIGPNHLETDIRFLPGFRGGPLLTADGRVVGVVAGPASRSGTRSGRRREEGLMAVRIDNLTVDELARVEESELDGERGLFRRIVTAFDEVSGAKDRDTVARLCLQYAGLCWECGEEDWGCDYFRRETLRMSNRLRALAGSLGLERQFRLARLPAFLLRHAAELEYRAIGETPVRCFGCAGIGRVNLAPVRKMRSFVDSAAFLDEAAKQEFVSCRFCSGTGRLRSGPPEYRFFPAEMVRARVLEQLSPIPEKFCDFTLGCTVSEFFRQEKFYRKRYNLFRRYDNMFGETLVYRGNHRERNVAATTLVFQFGRLTEVTLLVRCRGEEAKCLAAELCGSDEGRNLPPTVTVGPLQRAEDMPCDARGNPVEPVSYFDFTAAGEYFRGGSEPFWVIRVSLEAKAGLDRVDANALLRAGAKLRPGRPEERP